LTAGLAHSSFHESESMQHHWILDVLADLRSFARCNGLAALAEQLDDTVLVATAEIARLGGGPGAGQALDAAGAGGLDQGAQADEGA
jgi:hypothetical protein